MTYIRESVTKSLRAVFLYHPARGHAHARPAGWCPGHKLAEFSHRRVRWSGNAELPSPQSPALRAAASCGFSRTPSRGKRNRVRRARAKNLARRGRRRASSGLAGWARFPIMSTPASAPQAVQCFGRKKTAVAVAYCKKGKGILKLNGTPIELIQPELLRYKVFEPVLLLGQDRFAQVDIRIRCKGGGYTSQIYAIRQVRARGGTWGMALLHAWRCRRTAREWRGCARALHWATWLAARPRCVDSGQTDSSRLWRLGQWALAPSSVEPAWRSAHARSRLALPTVHAPARVCAPRAGDRRLRRALLPTTRSTWTRRRRRRSGTSSCSSTARSSSPTRAAPSRRSSAVRVPARASRRGA